MSKLEKHKPAEIERYESSDLDPLSGGAQLDVHLALGSNIKASLDLKANIPFSRRQLGMFICFVLAIVEPALLPSILQQIVEFFIK